MMSITKPRPKPSLEAFISSAPDAARQAVVDDRPTLADTERRRVIRGRKEQLTLTIAPDTVDRIDEARAKLGLSRTAWITQAVNLRLEAELAKRHDA